MRTFNWLSYSVFGLRTNEGQSVRNGLTLEWSPSSIGFWLRWGPDARRLRFSRRTWRFLWTKHTMLPWEKLSHWIRDEPHVWGYQNRAHYEHQRMGLN